MKRRVFGIKLPCFHRWAKSRFQFQSLGSDKLETSYTCKKCGKLKVVESA